jgi:outer membrane cobalamin receptor
MSRIGLYCLLLVSSWVRADADVVMERLFQMSLQELLEVTITSSTRHEESLSSVPASVTVYTRKQLRVLGIDRLNQLMNFVPGFQSQRFDNAGYSYRFSSRGYAGSSAGREILILLDGQRLNSDWSGGIYVSNGVINLDKIERIEFIRGPGSAIYGSNAYLGVVNLISQAVDGAHLSVASLNGSGLETRASVQWHGDFDAVQTDFFVNTTNHEGQDVRVFDPFKADNVNSSDPFVFEELYLKAKSERLSLAFYHSNTRNEQFYVSGFVSNGPNLLEANSQFIDLKYTQPLTPNVTFNSKLSLSQKRLNIAAVISPSLPPNELGIKGVIEEREPQAEISLSVLGDNGSKGLAGVEWRRPKIMDSDANLFGIANTYLPQAPLTHRTIYGFFVQYQQNINEQLNYVWGLRQDDYSNFGGHLSPKGALIWTFNERQTVKWLYGESFRAPSRSETEIQNSAAILANPDLTSEVARTTELIWQYQGLERFLTGTLFYTELENVITNAQTLPIERYNTGNENLAGVELEWHRQWTQQLSSRMNASWIFNGPNNQNSEAEVFAGASVVYQNNKFSAAIMINHHGSKQDVYVDDHLNVVRNVSSRSFIDAHFSRFLPHDLELYLHINNVSDETYNSVSQRAGNSQGVPSRGVGIMTGLRWQY